MKDSTHHKKLMIRKRKSKNWKGKSRWVHAFLVETNVRESLPSMVTVMKRAKWQIIVKVIGLTSALKEPTFAS